MNKTNIADCFIEKAEKAIPVIVLHERECAEWLNEQNSMIQQWAKAHMFSPKKGTVLAIPSSDGAIGQVIVGLSNEYDTAALARAAIYLPVGTYQLKDMPFYANYACMQSPLFYLAWGMEQYRFMAYKPSLAEALQQKKVLVLPKNQQLDLLQNMLTSICWTRDLINMPAQDMNPDTLEKTVHDLAQQYNASFKSIVGDKLLKENFPAIHAVGRASVFEPRLLELAWGNIKNPQVTLVGKGVCFDTGGLDLKPACGMLLMRKDMSGSAQVLGLARMIMAMELPIRLRVLIPAVENAVSGNAYHPGDIITTRKGLSITIDNTDAEGRVILCDTIAYAMENPPELLIDVASLTGASSMAFGYDIAPFFTTDDDFSADFIKSSKRVNEPVWPMPLYAPYKDMISPETVDLSNASLSGYAGSITAALFLQAFVDPEKNPHTTWVHFDTAGWNEKSRPGRPVGGEATVVRALFDYLVHRFGVKC